MFKPGLIGLTSVKRTCVSSGVAKLSGELSLSTKTTLFLTALYQWSHLIYCAIRRARRWPDLRCIKSRIDMISFLTHRCILRHLLLHRNRIQISTLSATIFFSRKISTSTQYTSDILCIIHVV